MSTYCERHGHQPPTGAPRNTMTVCLNCGADFVHQPSSASVDTGTFEGNPEGAALVDKFQGDDADMTKRSNPKDLIGSKKLSTSLVPTAVVRYAALAFMEGAIKYGRYNWRVAGVRMCIYLDALERHAMKLREGEWADPITGVPHLGSIIACSGIILDASECGMLVDDRPPISDNAVLMIDETAPEIVAHLKELFRDHHPHQHVITDAPNTKSE